MLDQGALKTLLKLCELPDTAFSPCHLRQIPESHRLIAAGALRPTAVPTSIHVAYRDEEVAVDIEADPERPGRWRYRCPETGRRLAIGTRDIQPYAIDFSWLARSVASGLSPNSAPSPDTLIAGTLWHLGAHTVGDRVIDVLLARRYNANLTVITGLLQSRIFRQPTLLLTTGEVHQPLRTNVGRFVPLALADCFVEDNGAARLDLGYLVHAIGLPREALVAANEVFFDPASGKLRLPGNPETHFTGDQQIAVVNELYLTWQRGSPDVKAAELLKKAGTATPTIPQLFSGKKDWRFYIANPKKGWYRLNV